jgi:hypothetical protein
MLKEELQFDAYVARTDQRLRSVPESIFEQLRNTEYFLFIDFSREKIHNEYRGSLFSHQELAIAAFLEIDNDVLVFQEKGIMERDGMIGAFQANAIPFQKRCDLVEIIKQQVKEKWKNNWRRKLTLEQANDPDCEAVLQRSGTVGYFFHIKVRNRHIRATARNCYAYLRSVKDATDQMARFEAAELRWAGCFFPNAIIPPGNFIRRFDAVWFDSGEPLRPRFNVLSDWPQSIPNLRGPGIWELEYAVISDNVPGSTIKLSLDVRPDNTVRLGQSQPVAVINLAAEAIDRFNRRRAMNEGH